MFATHPLYGTDTTRGGIPWTDSGCYTLVRGGQFLPTPHTFIQGLRQEYRARPDDIWISSFPKTGTTWLSHIVVQLLAAGDQEKVDTMRAELRSHGMFRVDLFMYSEDNVRQRLTNLEKLSSPRVLVHHLPEPEMPPQAFQGKVIVPVRNPKDTCVSFYHFHRATDTFGWFQGSFSHFMRSFLRGETMFGDYYSYYQMFWEKHASDSHVMFVHYEDMLDNPERKVREVAHFLNITVSDQLICTVLENTNFTAMKSKLNEEFHKEGINKNISPFFRRGVSKDWKNHLTVADNELFDKHHKEVMASTPGLVFRGMEVVD